MQWKPHQARRILALNKHLHRLELARLARMEALASKLKDEEKQLIAFLDGNRGLIAIFPELVLARLRTKMQEQKEAARAAEVQAKAAREQATRVKLTEKFADEAEERDEREFVRRELNEILGGISPRGKVSAP